MKKEGSPSCTLLWSILMSAPGPLVVGLGLLAGQSSTQIADFFRRTSELLAIVVSYVVYRMTAGDESCAQERRARLERQSNRFVGAMMCLGGMLMIAIALAGGSTEKGNVIPGLTIAVLGVIANTIFWRRYTRLDREEPNPILAVQARLYRAKSLVDGCVTVALTAVAAAPASGAALLLDLLGSVIVAGYLVFSGVQTIRESAA